MLLIVICKSQSSHKYLGLTHVYMKMKYIWTHLQHHDYLNYLEHEALPPSKTYIPESTHLVSSHICPTTYTIHVHGFHVFSTTQPTVDRVTRVQRYIISVRAMMSHSCAPSEEDSSDNLVKLWIHWAVRRCQVEWWDLFANPVRAAWLYIEQR